MSYKIIFLKHAENDLEDAFKWYEKQKAGLGWEFRADVSAAIDKISDDTAEYRIFAGNIHKFRLTRFPYHVYYQKNIERKEIIVHAVFHFKRDPNDIRPALE